MSSAQVCYHLKDYRARSEIMTNMKQLIDYVEAVIVDGMEIDAGTVYEHDDQDQIVVLGVHRVYRTYDTDTDEGELDSVVVQWADEWDTYGPLWGHSQTEPLDVFLSAVGDPIDDISFTTP